MIREDAVDLEACRLRPYPLVLDGLIDGGNSRVEDRGHECSRLSVRIMSVVYAVPWAKSTLTDAAFGASLFVRTGIP